MITSWQCSKCGNTTASTNKPLVGTCWKGGGHRWTKVAAPGGYASRRCGKCGNSITNGQAVFQRRQVFVAKTTLGNIDRKEASPSVAAKKGIIQNNTI